MEMSLRKKSIGMNAHIHFWVARISIFAENDENIDSKQKYDIHMFIRKSIESRYKSRISNWNETDMKTVKSKTRKSTCDQQFN